MNAMHSDGTIETSVNGTPFDVRLADVTFQMEMDGIATETECLSGVCDLDVIELTDCKTLNTFEKSVYD